MRSFAVALIVTALLCSGCLDQDSKTPEPPAEGEGSRQDPGTHPAPAPSSRTVEAPEAAAGPNTPPTVRLNVSNASGAAPLQVTFFIEAADDDGDPLHWLLDTDGDGTADVDGDQVPAQVPWTFWDVGNHSVVVTVEDGAANATAHLVVEATAPPPTVLPDPKVFRGTLTGAWIGADAQDGPAYVGQAGSHVFNITDAIGLVQTMTFTVRGTNTTALDYDFEVTAPDGTLVARMADDDVATMTMDGPLVVDDPALLHLPGDWRVTVRPGFAVSGPYEATVSFS